MLLKKLARTKISRLSNTIMRIAQGQNDDQTQAHNERIDKTIVWLKKRAINGSVLEREEMF